jgi:hypothetical protein
LSRPHAVTLAANWSGRAEQVLKRLGRAALGQKALHIEIDRRRADAFVILRRRDHPVEELGARSPAAMRAGVDRGLMLGDLDQRLGRSNHAGRTLARLSTPVRIEAVSVGWQCR